MSTCAKCEKPLEVEVEFNEDGEGDDSMNDRDGSSAPRSTSQTVPDDVLLACGDHFHWECLLDTYELDKCPKCARDMVSYPTSGSAQDAAPRILVDLNNEGGMQHQTDIFPILKEESYLRAYPEERKCRAFLEFCREGDHRAIVDLLQSCGETGGDEDDEDEEDDGDVKSALPSVPPDVILRYQDPIGDMQSGLHAAVAGGHREVAWLLLLLASNLSELEFPALVFQEAAALGVMREDQDGKADIRTLRDSFNRSAEDVALETGVIWNGWIGNGRLVAS